MTAEEIYQAIGDKVKELTYMMESPKRNINQPMRDLIANITDLHKKLGRSVLTPRNQAPRGASEAISAIRDKGTQTSPLIKRTTDCTPKRAIDNAAASSAKRSKTNRVEVLKNTPVKTNEQEKTGKWEVVKAKKNQKSSTQNTLKRDVKEVGNNDAKSSRRRRRPPRKDAIVVKSAGNISYAEILKRVKTEPSLKELIHEAVKAALGESVDVRALTELRQVEIRDLDEITTKEEVHEAVARQFQELEIPISAILGLRKAYGGTQTATLKVTPEIATKLTEANKIRIGLVICRIREKIEPKRCFKCMEYGHVAVSCKSSADLSNTCFKCGNKDHQAKNCTQTASCIMCKKKKESDMAHAMTSKMKILQLNLNHCESAQDLLEQTIREHKIDVAILSEPYKHKTGNGWASDTTGKSTIWNCGANRSQLMSVNAARGFVRARVEGTYIYSCYLPPSLTLLEATGILENLAQDVKEHRPVIVAGDFNAWAVNWGCPRTSPRGQALLEAFAMLDIALMNTGSQQTYQKAGTGSIIDLTFVSSSLVRDTKWFVSQHYTRSDHLAIICEIRKHGEERFPNNYDTRYKVKTMEAEIIEIMLADVTLGGDASEKTTQTMRHLTEACDAAMSKTKPNKRNSEPVYWWTADIAELRSECLRARRIYQRSRGTDSFQENQLQYKQKRKALKKAIKNSKRRCFLQLCDDADNDPWGLGYRFVMKKLKVFKPLPTTCPATLRNVVETLFPVQDTIRDHELVGSYEGDQNLQLTSKEELLMIIKRIKNNKAPGPDGIPNEALKVAIQSRTDIFVDLYNTCLKEGTFPTQWKLQKLVLIPKGSKPAEDPTGYRPLCMLDTAGKILERLIAVRLEAAIEDVGGLSPRQFGFRKARSTTDAVSAVKTIAQKAIEGTRWLNGSKEYCLIATLDVKNAFNTANWSKILIALDNFHIPSDSSLLHLFFLAITCYTELTMPCLCANKVERTQEKVECDKCNDLFHLNCVNLQPVDLEFLLKTGKQFTCDKCAAVRRQSLRAPSAPINLDDEIADNVPVNPDNLSAQLSHQQLPKSTSADDVNNISV
ncbi:uncharacterized protein LOC128869901 [Anastrepha ludens]|uniref:uncharacterized protein LOC128869901 n=1 Tax=Anastrepha ludens TaxID=28586 RepID=UPI0023AFAF1E|nr:uncharacterized protein LOC128869901 [Anastrepha ludens]